MYRTSMAADHGMLFVFSGDGMHSFHMQNTYIPLDMIFITSDLKIVNIDANAQPLARTGDLRLALPLCPRG